MGIHCGVSVSVRNLVEFILRSGDIAYSDGASSSDMDAGTKAHRKLQKEGGPDYRAEVRMKYTITISSEETAALSVPSGLSCPDMETELTVEGICDGIIDNGDLPVIDEIKSTALSLDLISEDYNPLHWAQAQCYAFMYAAENGIQSLCVRLTYYQIETGKVKRFYRERSFGELTEFFFDLLTKYKRWAVRDAAALLIREETAKALTFPYSSYRSGQRELAAACYRTIRARSTLYAEAPTGTGKTASVLFAAVKTLAEQKHAGRKLFYLTAKTVTSTVAVKACRLLIDNGFKGRCIALTSKEKLCQYEKKCDPEFCPFAKGHYDRINDAVYDILAHEPMITREILSSYADKYNVCPFELSLDVSMRCDIIICDYNYAFDPRAMLKRYFSAGGDYVLLTDEAHNLIDRGRDMYSCGIRKSSLLKAAASLSTLPPLVKKLKKINSFLLKIKKETADDRLICEPLPELYTMFSSFCEIYGTFLEERIKAAETEEAVELFFDMLSYVYLYENYDKSYFRFYIEKSRSEVTVKIFCADPSLMLERVYNKCTAVIFFSATLLPLDYCKKLLGRKNSAVDSGGDIVLTSPFAPENLYLLIARSFSAAYRYRSESYAPAAGYIYESVSRHKGNYLAFFPSFDYMGKVFDAFTSAYPGIKTIKQETELTEAEREAFLSGFSSSPEETLVAFAVMGGIFSEGIDLTGDRLSGAFIISVGIPQLCFERDIIKQIFDDRGDNGYDFAYRFPGFNRVLQAAGRVIRTEKDRGFVMLLDSRFLEDSYTRLFPPFWHKLWLVRTPEKAGELVGSFWSDCVPALPEPDEQ